MSRAHAYKKLVHETRHHSVVYSNGDGSTLYECTVIMNTNKADQGIANARLMAGILGTGLWPSG